MCWLLSYSVNRNPSCTGNNLESEENWWCSCASWWTKHSFKCADLQEKKVEVKTLTNTVVLRGDRSLMIRPDINIEEVYMSSLVYLDPLSCLMDRCYHIWTKENYFIFWELCIKNKIKMLRIKRMAAFLSLMLVQELAGMKASKHAFVSVAFMVSMTKSISRYITVHLVFDQ